MSEADIKYLIINLVPHLAALHALKVIHESIHPKHILATKNASGSLVFYLSGFQNAQISKGSISKTSSAAPLSQPGEKPETDWESASFTAPEIAKSGDAHNEKVDVWSFGKTLYVLLTGLISQGGKGTAISKNLSSLISSCLEKDPDKRISFRDILKHDFLVKSSPYAIIEHTKKPNLSLKSTSRKDITIPEKKKIEDYEIDFKNMIAKGVFSKIYVGKDVKTGIHYAVKRYEKQVVEEHLYMEAIMEELENMKRVQDSPYHLGFKEAFKLDQSGTANSYLYIVLEKCEGTLEELLVRRKKETFTPTEFKLLIWDLAKGIQEIRKQGAKGPCGITPNKILYKQDHNGKLTDFLISNYGPSKRFSYEHGSITVDAAQDYQAPEYMPIIVEGQNLSEEIKIDKGDAWTIGMIMYFAAFGTSVFKYKRNGNRGAILTGKQAIAYPSKEIPYDFLILMLHCLNPDPNKRPDIKALLDDKFLVSVELKEIDPGKVYDCDTKRIMKDELGEIWYPCSAVSEKKKAGKKQYIYKEFIFDKEDGKSEQLILRQIDLLSKLRSCDYISKLYDYFLIKSKKAIAIVTDYYDMTLQDLYNFRHAEGKGFSEEEMQKIVVAIIYALDYLHKRDVTYRELTMSNIHIEMESAPKHGEIRRVFLGDFGSAKFFTESLQQVSQVFLKKVNLTHQPYEIQLKDISDVDWAKKIGKGISRKITNKIDIWALGVVLYSLLTTREMQMNTSEADIISGKVVLPSDFVCPENMKKYLAMLTACLNCNPEKRPTAAELKKLL